MKKSNPTRPKYLLMLLAAGGLMFNVACTEDGISGMPGGFGSGQDGEVKDDGGDIPGKDDADGGGYIIPANDIWQTENCIKNEFGE